MSIELKFIFTFKEAFFFSHAKLYFSPRGTPPPTFAGLPRQGK